MEQLLNKALEILREFKELIVLADTVLTAILVAKVNAVRKNTTPADSSTTALPSKSSEEAAPSTVTVSESARKSFAKTLRNTFLSDLEIFASDKSDKEMTDQERESCDRILAYLEGGGHEVS